MSEILVPVSFGELLDKIAILQIKSERMSDPAKLANVQAERWQKLGKDKLVSLDDVQQRVAAAASARAQVEAQRLIEAVQSALKSDGELLSTEQQAKLEATIVKLQATALGENRRDISAAMDELEAATRDFAAKRMDKSIRRAFAGKSIDVLEAAGESSKNAGESAEKAGEKV